MRHRRAMRTVAQTSRLTPAARLVNSARGARRSIESGERGASAPLVSWRVYLRKRHPKKCGPLVRFCRRMTATRLLLQANGYQQRPIEAQERNGCSARRRHADQLGADPAKMLRPELFARVK